MVWGVTGTATAWGQLQCVQALPCGNVPWAGSAPSVSDTEFTINWWVESVPSPKRAKSCWAQAATTPIFIANTSSTSAASRAEARRRPSMVLGAVASIGA